ncbi:MULTISPECIES: Spx/MgsR family RNA polymerase-binding regulatory protein [Rhodonellum]|nr:MULTISPECIES: Spx/MgsR family RNA polymerase-binding regulatory protein [Rhodonellum]SDZ42654.1 transcriptional regulator, Spx/MgsR family [Rhodonellum ikkaensis]
MSLIVYGIKNCDTMKKTFSFLEAEGIEYDFVDYKKKAPSEDLLLKFESIVGIESLINKRGTTFRKLTDSEKSLLENRESAIKILMEKSSMIKRPIVEFPSGQLVLGFDPEEIKLKNK